MKKISNKKLKKIYFLNLLIASLSYWQCPLPYRSFAILWGPICQFLILEHKLLEFCSGKILVSMCSRFFATYLSISFSVSGFMWRSLINLDLSFVQVHKNGSIFNLLHVYHQLNPHHLLKILSFFHWMVLPPLSKIRWS